MMALTKTMLFLAEHVNLLEFEACPMEKPQFSDVTTMRAESGNLESGER